MLLASVARQFSASRSFMHRSDCPTHKPNAQPGFKNVAGFFKIRQDRSDLISEKLALFTEKLILFTEKSVLFIENRCKIRFGTFNFFHSVKFFNTVHSQIFRSWFPDLSFSAWIPSNPRAQFPSKPTAQFPLFSIFAAVQNFAAITVLPAHVQE
jgi:hypothetical protein